MIYTTLFELHSRQLLSTLGTSSGLIKIYQQAASIAAIFFVQSQPPPQLSGIPLHQVHLRLEGLHEVKHILRLDDGPIALLQRIDDLLPEQIVLLGRLLQLEVNSIEAREQLRVLELKLDVGLLQRVLVASERSVAVVVDCVRVAAAGVSRDEGQADEGMRVAVRVAIGALGTLCMIDVVFALLVAVEEEVVVCTSGGDGYLVHWDILATADALMTVIMMCTRSRPAIVVWWFDSARHLEMMKKGRGLDRRRAARDDRCKTAMRGSVGGVAGSVNNARVVLSSSKNDGAGWLA